MSGHSHWSGIKHQKEITDKKRAQVFSKLLIAISAAAKKEADPNFNPRLRTVIEKAKEASVPQDNILRAIKKASEKGEETEDLIFEAYGPGGTALLILAVSDKSNRTVAEVKNILNETGGKWAEPGSVRWAFNSPKPDFGEWSSKFVNSINPEDEINLKQLIEALLDHPDVQEVFANNQ